MVKGEPVVCSYDKRELTVGIVGFEMLKRVPCIRRLGQVKLVVGSHEPFLPGESLPCDGQSLVVVEKVGCRLLERVERRHEKPHLVEVGEAENLLCQANVPNVDGVETASENADTEALLAVGHWRLSFKEVADETVGVLLGFLQVVVDYNVVKLLGECQLVGGLGEPLLNHLGGIGGAVHESVSKFLY